MVFAIVPAAAPTEKKRRATSCPAPISTIEPYLYLSRLIARAFWSVVSVLSRLRIGCLLGTCRASGIGRWPSPPGKAPNLHPRHYATVVSRAAAPISCEGLFGREASRPGPGELPGPGQC